MIYRTLRLDGNSVLQSIWRQIGFWVQGSVRLRPVGWKWGDSPKASVQKRKRYEFLQGVEWEWRKLLDYQLLPHRVRRWKSKK